jgi:broad specificity phosphatase PhoE
VERAGVFIFMDGAFRECFLIHHDVDEEAQKLKKTRENLRKSVQSVAKCLFLPHCHTVPVGVTGAQTAERLPPSESGRYLLLHGFDPKRRLEPVLGKNLRVELADMKIFLIRHASPDWERRDIPYDIQPGPMLTMKGEKETEALAEFLKSQGVVKLFYSPFERAAKTAAIVAALNGIPAVEEPGLAEWRSVDELESRVRLRMVSVFQQAARESAEGSPTGLVSHGGPIALLLQELGIQRDELAKYRTMFDATNPLPPAGVWEVEKGAGEEGWRFGMVFQPEGIDL